MWNNGERSRMDKMRDTIRNITTFHQRSKYADDDEEQNGGLKKKRKKRPFSLPHWTTYIAWISKCRHRGATTRGLGDMSLQLLEPPDGPLQKPTSPFGRAELVARFITISCIKSIWLVFTLRDLFLYRRIIYTE